MNIFFLQIQILLAVACLLWVDSDNYMKWVRQANRLVEIANNNSWNDCRNESRSMKRIFVFSTFCGINFKQSIKLET